MPMIVYVVCASDCSVQLIEKITYKLTVFRRKSFLNSII